MPVFPQSNNNADANAGIGVIDAPQFWAGGAGWSYWLANPHADLTAVAAAANPAGLDGWGWVMTSVGVVETGTGDFMSSADNTPTYLQLTTAADSFRSPRVFGDYAGALAAKKFLDNAMPTKLVLEFYGAFPVNGTNENTTFIGFADGANSTATCAAAIRSNGANFVLEGGAASDVGAALDANFHLFRIEVGSATTEWFIDDASQGTIATQTDLWPLPVKALVTNNDIYVAWINVRYEV